MIVYYKVSDALSTNPSPIFTDNKRELVKHCLKSFVKAYEDVKPKVIFIVDNSPEDYMNMIDSICPFQADYHLTNLGNFEASRYQYKLAKDQDEDILFQEDDYTYLPNIGQKMVDGLNELGLVSPYDHPNFYKDNVMHSELVKLKLIGSTHWRTTERNTMTFAIKNDIFKRNYEIFDKYGNWDSDVWREIDAQLWTPVPSFATHMVKDWISPNFNFNGKPEPKNS